jgi:hypothetical protein
MLEQHHRPWTPLPAAPMAEEIVAPLWSENGRIVGQLTYRNGKEEFDPIIVRSGGAALAEEDDD